MRFCKITIILTLLSISFSAFPKVIKEKCYPFYTAGAAKPQYCDGVTSKIRFYRGEFKKIKKDHWVGSFDDDPKCKECQAKVERGKRKYCIDCKSVKDLRGQMYCQKIEAKCFKCGPCEIVLWNDGNNRCVDCKDITSYPEKAQCDTKYECIEEGSPNQLFTSGKSCPAPGTKKKGFSFLKKIINMIPKESKTKDDLATWKKNALVNRFGKVKSLRNVKDQYLNPNELERKYEFKNMKGSSSKSDIIKLSIGARPGGKASTAAITKTLQMDANGTPYKIMRENSGDIDDDPSISYRLQIF